jgi:hypothetical protein
VFSFLGHLGSGEYGDEREVKGLLPYRLKYQTLIVALDPPREARYIAEGDLHGKGRNILAPDTDGLGTIVTFYWDVWTTGLALNLLSPLLKPLFAWNHNWVMAQGERGLIAKLAPSRVS